MKKQKILLFFGTRPEAIKFAPLHKTLLQNSDMFETKVCISSQHKEMLEQIMSFFGITADYDLNIMLPNQTLIDIVTKCLVQFSHVVDIEKPDLIFVQGDTSTAFIGAYVGFLKKVKVAHLEAGLRSGNKFSPFPEEGNRVLIGHLADFHFAPTLNAKDNLEKENITNNVFVVGNTVIDALHLGLSILENADSEKYQGQFSKIKLDKRIVLITGHRRESFGEPFENICNAIKTLATNFPDVEFVYPVHLNPNVQSVVYSMLSEIKNVHLLQPLEYPSLLFLLKRCNLVLTDSGGIQEEAPSLGIPVIVMRDVTERTEGIESGNAVLVGTSFEKIVNTTSELLTNEQAYSKMSEANNSYGSGDTSQKVVRILAKYFSNE